MHPLSHIEKRRLVHGYEGAFLRPIPAPHVHNKIRKIEVIVHPGWASRGIGAMTQKRVERIQSMSQEQIDETFFVMFLGGILPEERREEMHRLWACYQANELEHYPGCEKGKQILRDAQPKHFLDFVLHMWEGAYNLNYADVISPLAEVVLSSIIRSRTRQIFQTPAIFKTQDITCSGLPLEEAIRERWLMDKQLNTFFHFLNEHEEYFSHKLETLFYGEYKEACVAKTKYYFDCIFAHHFGHKKIDSKIISELSMPSRN